jgi:hypothetical protein
MVSVPEDESTINPFKAALSVARDSINFSPCDHHDESLQEEDFAFMPTIFHRRPNPKPNPNPNPKLEAQIRGGSFRSLGETHDPLKGKTEERKRSSSVCKFKSFSPGANESRELPYAPGWDMISKSALDRSFDKKQQSRRALVIEHQRRPPCSPKSMFSEERKSIGKVYDKARTYPTPKLRLQVPQEKSTPQSNTRASDDTPRQDFQPSNIKALLRQLRGDE